MPLKLTSMMVTSPPQWAKPQLRKHRLGWAFGAFCNGSSHLRDSPDC